MIGSASRSYPVLGAAQAAGVPYWQALAFVGARRSGDLAAEALAFHAMESVCGLVLVRECARWLTLALDDGRIWSAGRCCHATAA